MYKLGTYYPEYEIPLKSEIPCLQYDIAVYCKYLLEKFYVPLPKYLCKFEKCLLYHANRANELFPNEFPNAYRSYIFDNRLNLLFASLDVKGKLSTWFSKYGKFAHELEDYCFGDGEMFEDNSNASENSIKKVVSKFSKSYGFLPLEELSMSVAIVFDGSKIVEKRLLSTFQAHILMEKFKSQNLIDWKAIVSKISHDYKF